MSKIIISYRRADSAAISGRIFDRLVSHYEDDAVFMDVDKIPFGTDFREHIRKVLLEGDILLAVIGPNWLGKSSDGTSRIKDEADPVRVEIESALRQKTRMIPVLVDGATMRQPPTCRTLCATSPISMPLQSTSGATFAPTWTG